MIIDDAELEYLLAQCCTVEHPVPAPMLCDREGRRHQRWRVYGLYAHLYWRGQHYPLQIRDLSLSGLGVGAIPDSIEVGERAIVMLDLEEYGTLATSVALAHVSGSDGDQQMGLEFLPHSVEDLLPLVSYLNDLANQLTEA